MVPSTGLKDQDNFVVERFFDDILPDGHKLFGGNNCRGVFTTLNLALIGTLEGGVDGDDPAWT